MLDGVDIGLAMSGLPEAEERSVNNPAMRRKRMVIVVDVWSAGEEYE